MTTSHMATSTLHVVVMDRSKIKNKHTIPHKHGYLCYEELHAITRVTLTIEHQTTDNVTRATQPKKKKIRT
jgi:hypothetical protein